ncbi:MAG: serine protease [Actinomycetota bacterium]|nr:serine protease [Actinomycetota bacterium]
MATARHVLEGKRLDEVTQFGHPDRPLNIERTLVPKDEGKDVALLQTDFDGSFAQGRIEGVPDNERTDHIRLGTHLDAWVRLEFVMTRCLVMGYPRIPQAKTRGLVSVAGHVNAVIDKMVGSTHPHFIISPVARGGFSGGPVISEYGFLLGVYTEELLEKLHQPAGTETGAKREDAAHDDAPATPPPREEAGFAAALSVQPLWELLLESGVAPGTNAEFVKDLAGRAATGEELMALLATNGAVGIDYEQDESGEWVIALRPLLNDE